MRWVENAPGRVLGYVAYAQSHVIRVARAEWIRDRQRDHDVLTARLVNRRREVHRITRRRVEEPPARRRPVEANPRADGLANRRMELHETALVDTRRDVPVDPRSLPAGRRARRVTRVHQPFAGTVGARCDGRPAASGARLSRRLRACGRRPLAGGLLTGWACARGHRRTTPSDEEPLRRRLYDRVAGNGHARSVHCAAIRAGRCGRYTIDHDGRCWSGHRPSHRLPVLGLSHSGPCRSFITNDYHFGNLGRRNGLCLPEEQHESEGNRDGTDYQQQV